MSNQKRGTCPVCNREFLVTSAGVMRVHRSPRTDRYSWGGLPDCDGVGQPPVAITPDPIAAAEARGFDKAVEALRARAVLERDENPNSPTMWAVYLAAADHLDHVRADRLGTVDGAEHANGHKEGLR